MLGAGECQLGARFLGAAQKGPEAGNLGAQRGKTQGRSQPRQAAQSSGRAEVVEPASTKVRTGQRPLEMLIAANGPQRLPVTYARQCRSRLNKTLHQLQ